MPKRETVTSDRAPRRRRGSLLGWALRRLGALALVLALLAGASLMLAPTRSAPPLSAGAGALSGQGEGPLFPDALLAPETEAPRLPARPGQQARRQPAERFEPQRETSPFDGLDILTAAELARISQAREDGASQFAAASQAATTPGDSEPARVREISDEQDQGGQSRRRARRR